MIPKHISSKSWYDTYISLGCEEMKTFDGLSAGSTYRVSLYSIANVGCTILEGEAVYEEITLCKL